MFTKAEQMHITKEPIDYNWQYSHGSKRIAHAWIEIDKINSSSMYERTMFNNGCFRPREVYPEWPENELELWLEHYVPDMYVEVEFTYRVDRDSIMCELQIRGTVPLELLGEYEELLVMFKMSQ